MKEIQRLINFLLLHISISTAPMVTQNHFSWKYLGVKITLMINPSNEKAKKKICDSLLQEAEQFLGGAMTYSLIEFIKEKYDELTAEDFSLTTFVEASSPVEETVIDKEETVIQTKLEKKVHLTKAQKRKQWDRVDNKGERPRGWNWVDIVHHLTQTGTKQPTTSDN
ncbi:RWD domain-containing protein 4 isoform X3 [Rhodnius prolixus]|uniref:RWD domain-containing protein 4 isoform X3 n=1 Tax=Rhodnius prolixus TaxID=13249 RepID=UPI003D18A729